MQHTSIQELPLLGRPDNFHFAGECEDCDVQRLSRMSLETLEDGYRTGVYGHDLFEAYMHVWALLSPQGEASGWTGIPGSPDVRRIARKLCVLRGISVPATLEN